MPHSRTLLVLLLLLAAARAESQGIAGLPSGARVRVTLPDSMRQDPLMPRAQSIIGTVARTSADTLWLKVGDLDSVRLPVGAIRRVYVSRGVSRARSALGSALVTGFAIGAVAHNSGDVDSTRDEVTIGAVAAVVGAVIGALRPYERWRRVR